MLKGGNGTSFVIVMDISKEELYERSVDIQTSVIICGKSHKVILLHNFGTIVPEGGKCDGRTVDVIILHISLALLCT